MLTSRGRAAHSISLQSEHQLGFARFGWEVDGEGGVTVTRRECQQALDYSEEGGI